MGRGREDKTMNLRFKLFTAFVVLIIIPLILLGVASFIITSNLLEKKYSQQAEFTLRALSNNINSVFLQLNNVTDTGIANSVLEMALDGNYSSQDLTDADQLQLNERQKSFRSLLYSHPSISFAFLYNLKTAGSSPIVTIFDKEGFVALPFNDFSRHPLYHEVMELNGVPKWIGPREFPELTGYEPVFTQIRLVKETIQLRNIAILTVQIKNWEIERIFNEYRYSPNLADTRFFLTNGEGLVLFDSFKEFDGLTFMEHLSAERAFIDGYDSYRGNFDKRDSIINVLPLKDYGWYLISVKSWNSLSQEMLTFIYWMAAIMLLCVLGALMFNMFFINRITGNITRIVRFMRRVEDGERNARVAEDGNDELSMLAKGFNSLTSRISGLLQQVKEEQDHKKNAEMRALQAQIKPHFLFNTLESINVLAVQNEGKKVSQMVYRLGNILRISIQEKEEITLFEEIEHLTNYLEIQKFRFEDIFNYDIEMPEHLQSCLIPKLTLQPLVENCLQHGFDGMEKIGFIRIAVSEDSSGNLIITIEDNGVGMNSHQLAKFQYMTPGKAEPSDRQKEQYNTERRGLGVRSVADRIRIQYGPVYGLFICSMEQEGTLIRCILPKYEQGERHDY